MKDVTIVRCPDLSELPTPPSERTGWPWTEESQQLQDTMPNGQPWPKISIVTPSYNQGQFLEETIRSVLLQGYPNLEYMIIDGGSSDNSVDIIKKYEPWLTYWVSEPDRGQAHAINKGFQRAAGEIVGWLNSDDVYTSGAIAAAALQLTTECKTAVVYGKSAFIDEGGNITGHYHSTSYAFEKLLYRCMLPQPSSFLRKDLIKKEKLLDEKYFFIMDYALWVKLGLEYRFDYVPSVWSYYRKHASSKSVLYELRRWLETIEMFEALFEREDIREEVTSLKSSVVGNAYWHAALVLFQSDQRSEAQQHLRTALRLSPKWPLSRKAQNMIVTYAMQTESPEDWLRGFFALVSMPLINYVAFRRSLAWYYAIRALESRQGGDKMNYAMRAVANDPAWITDRNLMYRLFSNLFGRSTVNLIRRFL